MAQIVIFAPPGVDASAGEEALKGAGHDVEVVEAKPENLLHIAIGMLDTSEEETTDETTTGEGDADEMAGTAPEETVAPEDELAGMDEEEPAKLESLGVCAIDGDKVVVRRGKHTVLYVKEIQRGDKITFALTESTISLWEDTHRFMLSTSTGKVAGATAKVQKSKFGETYLVAGPELHQYFL